MHNVAGCQPARLDPLAAAMVRQEPTRRTRPHDDWAAVPVSALRPQLLRSRRRVFAFGPGIVSITLAFVSLMSIIVS